MQEWEVTITALQPLSIAKKPDGNNHWDTISYIPGSVLRGAIAELWDKTVGFENPLWKDLFLKGIWRDAHPKKGGGEIRTLDQHYLKNGSQKCKQEKSIIPEYIAIGYVEPCGEGGNYLRIEDPYRNDIIMDQTVGIQISPERESIMHGRLFTYSHIAAGTEFVATMLLPEEGLRAIGYQEGDIQIVTTYVGKKRSSGYGKVKIEFKKRTDQNDGKVALRKKIEAYTRVLIEEIKRISLFRGITLELEEDSDTWYISIVNRSPMILLDRFLRATNRIDWLLHLTKTEEEKNTIGNLISESRFHTLLDWGLSEPRYGWNSVWNLPKEVNWTIKPGAIALYRLDALSEKEKDILLGIFLRISKEGVGERRNEGFGEVEICPPIYLKEEKLKVGSDIMPRSVTGGAPFTEQLIELAQSFVEAVYGKVKKSQWHHLLNQAGGHLVDEIMNRNPESYLEKRLSARVKRGWKEEVVWRGNKDMIGNHLRKVVEEELREISNKGNVRQNDVVRSFIRYVIGFHTINETKKEEEIS